jgi:Transposase DDE domain
MPKHNNTRPCRKSLYRVKNWSEYDDHALVVRGSIIFWMSDDFPAPNAGRCEKTWSYAGTNQRGSQYEYSEQAILLMQTLKNVFHLTNRSTEGFVKSIFALRHILLDVPDHTTLSRRSKVLNVKLPKKASGDLVIVLDSSGLKIFGEGE